MLSLHARLLTDASLQRNFEPERSICSLLSVDLPMTCKDGKKSSKVLLSSALYSRNQYNGMGRSLRRSA